MLNRRSFSSLSFQSAAHSLTIITVIASVIEGLLERSNLRPLLFSPLHTLYDLELWRPFTALFIAISPIEIIFTALIMYSIGGLLESRWGRRRFVTIIFGIPLLAEFVTILIAALSPETFFTAFYPGTRQVVTTLWIMFGLSSWFSGQMLNFWGTPITGKTFALVGLGFVILSGIFGSLTAVIPELIAAGLSYGYMYRSRLPRLRQSIELAYYTWKLRRLRSKSKFRLVKGSRSDEGDPDSTVH